MAGKYLKARQLAKEMEEKAKKTAEKKKEAKNKEEQAKESLEVLDSLRSEIELDDLKGQFEEGKDELDKKNFEKGYDLFEEIIEEINKRSLEEHSEIIDPIEKLLQEAGEDIGLESLQEKIDESRSLIQDGKLKEGFDKAFELEDESDEIINKSLKEELEKLKSIIDMLNESADSKEKAAEFISKAEYSLEAEDYRRTFSLLEDTKETFGDEVKDSLKKRLETLKERKNQLKEHGVDIQDAEEGLKDATSKIDDGEHLEALGLIEESRGEINPLYGEEILRDKFNELTYEINEAEDIGADTESVEKIHEEAEKLKDENNIEKAESRLEDAFEQIEEVKFDKVLNTIAESREDFIKAKEMGANIEKPMELLKKARNSLKNDEYKEALEWARKGREEVQGLTKELEKAKKDIADKRDDLSRLREVLDEDLSALTDLIDEAEEKLEEKKTDDAISVLEEVDDKIETEVHDDILDIINKFGDLIEVAEELGIDIKEFSKEKEESEKKLSSSEYVEAADMAQKGKNSIRERIESRLDEKIQELRKSLNDVKGLDNKVEEEIFELIEDCENKIDEGSYSTGLETLKEAEDVFEESKKETIDKLIEKNSQILSEMGETDQDSIGLDTYKEMIEEAKRSVEEEMYTEALNDLYGFLSDFSQQLHTESKKEIEKAEETGVDVESLEKELEKSKDKMDEGDYTDSIGSSIKVRMEAEENRKMRKEAREKISEGSSKLSKLREKGKLEGDASVNDLLEDAEKKLEEENYSGAIEDAEEALDSLGDLEIETEFSKGKKELKDKFAKAKNIEMLDKRVKNFDLEIEKIDKIREDEGISAAKEKIEEKQEELENLLEEMVKDRKEEIDGFVKIAEVMGCDIKDYKDELDKTKSLIDQGKSLDALISLEEIEEGLKDLSGEGEAPREKIEEVRALLRKAEILGANTEEAEKLLEEARKKLGEDNFEECLEKANSAEDKIQEAQKKRIENILENFNDKIEKLKKKGVYTKLAEKKIRKAKKSKDDENYTDAIRFAMESEGELEKINNQRIIAGNILSRTEKLLNKIKDEGVFVDEAKEKFQECKQAFESGFFPKAVENSLDAAEELTNILQTYNNIGTFLESVNGVIDELKKGKKDIPDLVEEKNRIEENYKDGKYQQAVEHMRNVEEIILDHENEVKDIISKMEKDIEENGIKNVEESIEKLKKAKFLIDLKNTVKSLQNIEEARELSGLKKQKGYIDLKAQVEESLKNAKRFGASVERVEKKVQEAKDREKSQDLDGAYDKIEQAHNLVEEVLEDYSPKLKLKFSDTLTINKWNTTYIHLINEGKALGKNLQIELRGGELRNFKLGGKIKAGEKKEVEVEIRPEKENASIIARTYRIFDNEIFEDEQELNISMGSKIKKADNTETCDYCGDEIKKGSELVFCSCGKKYEISCGKEISECLNCGTKLETEKEKKQKKKRVSLDL